ncbi:MAG: NUDIX hydrolase [Oscillospiraceae bacterium]|jgi:ADP-ribose pyrophosphatase|nr:NUDIX hydrolase [Oscillospiraceae bacterium]
MSFSEKFVSRKEIYRGRIIGVHADDILLPDGKPGFREVVTHPGGVCMAALTGTRELLFVRQFRYPYGELVTELPAGKLEPGEDPFEAGKRELLEETGATAAQFESLGVIYPSPGYCNEVIHLYLARKLTFSKLDLDEDEFLEPIRIPLDKAAEMVMSGELRDAKTVIGILKVKEWLRGL